MAFDLEKFKDYSESLSNRGSESNFDGAASGIINGGGNGVSFEEGDTLFFDVDKDGKVDIRKNTSLGRTVWTCTAVTKDGEYVEVWPGTIARSIRAYTALGNGAFAPVQGKPVQTTPPLGFELNAQKFWTRYAGLKLKCKKVHEVTTLAFDNSRLVQRKAFEWAIVKDDDQA